MKNLIRLSLATALVLMMGASAHAESQKIGTQIIGIKTVQWLPSYRDNTRVAAAKAQLICKKLQENMIAFYMKHEPVRNYKGEVVSGKRIPSLTDVVCSNQMRTPQNNHLARVAIALDRLDRGESVHEELRNIALHSDDSRQYFFMEEASALGHEELFRLAR